MCLKNRIVDEEIKDECLKRLRILKLNKDVINGFKKENKVYMSQPTEAPSEITQQEMRFILELEKRKNVTVYHTLKVDNDTFYLYVDENTKEWKNEKTDLKLGYAVGNIFI